MGSGLGTQLLDEEQVSEHPQPKGNNEDTANRIQLEFQQRLDESLRRQADEYERKLKRIEKITEMRLEQTRVQKPEEPIKQPTHEGIIAIEEVAPKKAQKKHSFVEPPPKKMKTEKRQEKESLIKEASDSEPDPVAGSCKFVY